MKHFLLFIALSVFTRCFCQNTFQKTYFFNDTVAIIQNVHSTDSGYYFTATVGNHPDRFDLLFGKFKLDGSIDYYNQIQTPDADFVFWSNTELVLNYRNNFIAGYNANPQSGLSLPKFVELDFDGNVIDSFYLSQFHNSGVNVTLKQLISLSQDSSYLAFGSYSTGNSKAALLFKFNEFGDTLWSKKFFTNLSLNNLVYFRPLRIISLENGNLLFSVVEERDDFQKWAKIHFYKVNENGDLINHQVFQDSQSCYGTSSLLSLPDGSIMHTYLESAMVPFYYQPELLFRPVISKLDSNFQQIWKDTLNSQYFNLNEHATPTKLVLTEDGHIVGAHHQIKRYWYDSTLWQSMHFVNRVNVVKYTKDGTLLWNRKFEYMPTLDSLDQIDYTLKDIEITSDKGFIICGDVTNYDSLNADIPGQSGYLLKINCLGFFGSPEAYCSHQINEGYAVDFYNSSMQAGSYEWDFGDGSPILWTGETDDTVSHQYTDFGPFLVTMIAHGCNGDNDTLKFYVSPALHLDPSIITEGQGYFAIFPNPVISGNKLIVYLNGIDPSLGDVKLELYTAEAKLVQSYPIGYEEGSYLIEFSIASGMYHINLIQGGKVLQSRKLIIE